MKNKLILLGIALGIVGFACIVVFAWKLWTITDPYLVRPIKSSPAPAGASVGYSVESATRTLSVVSSNDVVVVADPDFKYVDIWLIERPRKDGGSTLIKYSCELPKYASADHIHPVDSQVSARIQRAADGRLWR